MNLKLITFYVLFSHILSLICLKLIFKRYFNSSKPKYLFEKNYHESNSYQNNFDTNKPEYEPELEPDKDDNKQHNKLYNKNDTNKGLYENKPKLDNRWKEILGRSGPNKHAHVLAIEHINNGGIVTAKLINEILAYSNIKITEQQLKSLINTTCFTITSLNKKSITKEILKNKIGLPNSKKKIPGIYIFTHNVTGRKYVGSSSQLALRLNGYINLSHRSTGLFMPLLKKEKLNNFTLQVFPFYDDYIEKSEIVLEQYYLLDPSFTLNTIKVANNPSGSTSKSLYMYNRDMTTLYYFSTQQIDFITKFNIHHTTFTKHLTNNTYYLGKYLFSRTPVLTAKVKNISDLELASLLEKDRTVYNKNKPLNSLSKRIKITQINKVDNVIILPSLGKCIEYFHSKGLSCSQTTLVKYINLKKPYKGYLCEYVLNSSM